MPPRDGPYGDYQPDPIDPAKLAQATRERDGIRRRRDAEIREARASGQPPEIVQKLIAGTMEKFDQEMADWVRKWGTEMTGAVEAFSSAVKASRRRRRRTDPEEQDPGWS
jgi:translation elongation factor EF-Ts